MIEDRQSSEFDDQNSDFSILIFLSAMGKKETAASVVTDRGQVTIPGEIRRRLGIVPGTTLRFHAEGGRLIAIKETTSDPVSRVYGIAGNGNTDDIMTELRGAKGLPPSTPTSAFSPATAASIATTSRR
jgi:AbrB family looped-hinge helix DNA binding protein